MDWCQNISKYSCSCMQHRRTSHPRRSAPAREEPHSWRFPSRRKRTQAANAAAEKPMVVCVATKTNDKIRSSLAQMVCVSTTDQLNENQFERSLAREIWCPDCPPTYRKNSAVKTRSVKPSPFPSYDNRPIAKTLTFSKGMFKQYMKSYQIMIRCNMANTRPSVG